MRMPKGFTLVELLVVITIIVILISILTPATEKALGQAQAAACGSNQHQIGLGIHNYMYDYNRLFPYGNTIAPPIQYPNNANDPGWQAKPLQETMLQFMG